jgi:DNA invertase Pin-like site-specific DNA recombinase
MGICGIYVRTSVETDGTSIEQQKNLGIKFCEAQGFQSQVYEDAGKSGFKIDDETDPFKNRQGLKDLIDDIKNKMVDKIWVYEHSRLSRNQLATFVLNKIFEKNKVVIYENGKLFKMDDPQSQMIQGILAQISQYERHLITSRTTRGLRSTINTGLRTYNKIYGYRNTGKQGKYIKWEPVQSEIENIKYSFQKYLEGNSVDSIIKDLNKDLPEDKRVLFHKNYINVLRRFDYTGFSLTTEGSELYKKYKNLEIDNLDFLKEQENGKPKYYLPSINYPIQIISLEDWIAASKRLQKNKQTYKNMKRRTSSDIYTGIINCPYCNLNYYKSTYDDGKHYFQYYTHIASKKCLQRPKSVHREKINNLVEVFYFYFYLVYDDTKKLLKENQEIMNINLSKIKDKISVVENENKKVDKQIKNLQSIYEGSTDKEFVKLTLKKEAELNLKLKNNDSVITKLKTELSELIEEINRDKMELTYYNTKDLIISFIEKLSVEDKRSALIKIIKKCQLFGNYLLIGTENLLFIYNVKKDYKLPDEVYERFKKDKNFKDNFLSSNEIFNDDGEFTDDIQKFFDTPHEEKKKKYTQEQINKIRAKVIQWKKIHRFDEWLIEEYYLSKPDDINKMKNMLNELNIFYNLENIRKVISFNVEL